MKLLRSGLMLVVGIAVLGAALQLGGANNRVGADDINTWLDGAISLSNVGETTVWELNAQNSPPCEAESVPVIDWNFNYIFKHYEQHCMRNLGNGRIDDLYKVYQPSNSDFAFNISGGTLGPSTFINPINDSGSAMYMSNSGSYWYLRYAPHVAEYIKFHETLFGDYFTLDMPREMLGTSDGNHLKFDSKLAYSDNDQYMVASASQFGYARVDLQTKEVKAFLPNTPNDFLDRPTDADKAISPSGQYAAVAFNTESTSAAYFRIVDVNSCSATDKPYNKTTDTCKSYDYLSLLRQEIPGISKVISLQFVNDHTLNFVAQIGWTNNIRYVRYQMVPFGQSPHTIDYLAMGDSFASGEGAFNYREGTDKNPNKCHQSLFSYPYLLGGLVGTTKSVACSGAVINNITGARQQDQINQLGDTKDKDIPATLNEFAKENYFPGVRAQKTFVDQTPQIITISISGNDVGFKDIIQACVTPTTMSSNCYELYEDRLALVNDINSKYNELKNTYIALKQNDPTRRVYVIGYPYIISATGSCGVNVGMSDSDRKFAVQLTDYLDSVIERAAAEAGVFYVDTRHALDGHKLCDSGVKAVNGLTEGDDSFLRIANESYHPNRMGQQLLADTIALQTDGLTKPMPKSRIIPAMNIEDIDLLKGIPHSAAPPPKRVWIEQNDGRLMFTGSDTSVNVSENDTQRILRSGTVMKAELHSQPVDVGSLTVDANGALVGTLHIPADVPVGFHTLHVYGQDKYYQDVDVQLSVYVGASPDDYDGDGIPNREDSCVIVPPSGKDEDRDGIDDACDPVIEEVAQVDDGQGDAPGEADEHTDSSKPAEDNAQQKNDGYVLGHAGSQTLTTLRPAQSRRLFELFTDGRTIASDTKGSTPDSAAGSGAKPRLLTARPHEVTIKNTHTKTYWLPAALVVLGTGILVVVTTRRWH